MRQVMALVAFFLICGFTACTTNNSPMIEAMPDLAYVETQLAKFTEVEISYDDSYLTDKQRKLLGKLVEASRMMDEIFLRQVYHGNVELAEAVSASEVPQTVQSYFKHNFGPFDRLEADVPFLSTVAAKPIGANHYPADMDTAEFSKWITDHPEDAAAFRSHLTVIRRDENGLKAVPYSEAYAEFLKKTSVLLLEAADLAENPSLKTYLQSRSDAFLSDDYYQSDIDWMDLKDHDIEVVIGPYEVYEDGLLAYKAAFESFITLVDRGDSEKLELVGRYLNELEKRLPIAEKHKNYNRGGESPIKVVNEVYTGGEARSGVHTIAFNLPNDERVREAKGSKKVMLKNISRAKYENVSMPIMERILHPDDYAKVSFDAFFYHVLLHEMVHGIGPGNIVKDGKQTTVALELKDTYSTLEEAKADIVGLFHFPYMVQAGVFDSALADQIYASFVGGMFRSVRFGIGAAHGGGNVIILNYLMENGGVEFDTNTEQFSVNYNKIGSAVRDLSKEILMLQALGDYAAAKAFMDKYRYESDELNIALSKLDDLPVDILVRYVADERYPRE